MFAPWCHQYSWRQALGRGAANGCQVQCSVAFLTACLQGRLGADGEAGAPGGSSGPPSPGHRGPSLGSRPPLGSLRTCLMPRAQRTRSRTASPSCQLFLLPQLSVVPSPSVAEKTKLIFRYGRETLGSWESPLVAAAAAASNPKPHQCGGWMSDS